MFGIIVWVFPRGLSLVIGLFGASVQNLGNLKKSMDARLVDSRALRHEEGKI